jgi:hypothetical protein
MARTMSSCWSSSEPASFRSPAGEGAGGIGAFGRTDFKNKHRRAKHLADCSLHQAQQLQPVPKLPRQQPRDGRSCAFIRPTDVRGNPRLGAVQNNGGPTFLLRRLSGSPALGAGGSPFASTDQRGVARPQGPASDVGAFERKR